MKSSTVNGSITRQLVARFVMGLFYPVACICPRYGLNEQQAGEILRWCFVKAALTEREFAASDRNVHRQTISRAAVQTGLTRAETYRYSRRAEPEIESIGRATDRATRVLSAWTSDPRYHDADGKPAELALRGSGATFQELTLRWGRDTPPRSIADVLVAAQCAEWVDGKHKMLRFVSEDYCRPGEVADDWDALSITAANFARALREALRSGSGPRPRFRHSFFTDVSARRVPELRDRLYERMAVFDKECNDLVSSYRTGRTGKSVVKVGTCSFTCFEPDPMN